MAQRSILRLPRRGGENMKGGLALCLCLKTSGSTHALLGDHGLLDYIRWMGQAYRMSLIEGGYITHINASTTVSHHR
jgi:hypothetical protein